MNEKICKINSASQTFNTVYQNVDFFTRMSEKNQRFSCSSFSTSCRKHRIYILFFWGGGKLFSLWLLGTIFLDETSLKFFS